MPASIAVKINPTCALESPPAASVTPSKTLPKP
jgi:hypothetical protein